MPTTLSDTQLGKLEEGLEAAITDLNSTRTEMAERNKQVDALLTEQKQLSSGSTEQQNRLADVTKSLNALSERMETLAEQNTQLVHQTRDQMKMIGLSTGDSDHAFVVTPSGTPVRDHRQCAGNQVIFKNRRQAVEMGMYFMATQHKETDARLRARQWIKNQGEGMKYLPQMPISFLRDFGNEWAEKINALRQRSDDPSTGLVTETLKGGATPGSALAHPEFSDTLIRNVEEHGRFRQNAMIWPMGADTVWIPRRDGGVTVAWEGEAEAGTTTEPDFTLLGMTAKKMLMLTQFSSELTEDSVVNLAAIMMLEYALAFANEEDRIGFNGTGTGGNDPGFAGFTGVLGAAANATPATADANGVPILVVAETGDDTTPEITEYTLREMTGELHTWARANAKWFLHRTVLADLAGISMGSAGGSVVSFREPLPASIMGYPVVEVEELPVSPSSADTKVLALGDLHKSWILGDRRQVAIETSEHYAFNSDQLTTRAKARISFLMIQGNGMVVLQTAS